jgi:hypothetical protein
VRFNVKYKVGENTFDTFDHVVQWAWEVHKIELASAIEELDTEELKQAACDELDKILKGELSCSETG